MISKRIYINDEPSLYIAYDNGDIFSEYTNLFLKPFKNSSGYCLVDLHHNHKSYTRQVHRIIATLFIPNPEKLETVNHKNGNKQDNSVENLEWMTRLDNIRHAWETGLAKPRYGINNPANVYTEEQIHLVCSLLETGDMTNKDVALHCGVNVTLIRDIKYRNKWKHISSLYNISYTPAGYKELRPKIFELMDKGYSNIEILECLNLRGAQPRRHIEYVRSIYNRCSLNGHLREESRGISE